MAQREISPRMQELLDTERDWRHDVELEEADMRMQLRADSIDDRSEDEDGDEYDE